MDEKIMNKIMYTVLLLDATGSMADLRDKTVEGINAFMNELKAKPEIGPADSFECWLFNGGRDTPWNVLEPQPLKETGDFDGRGYVCGYNTPLINSVYWLLERQKERLNAKHQVLFITMTDGKNNVWNRPIEELNQLILEMRKSYLLTMAFLGCDMDMWDVATQAGLDQTQSKGSAMSYASADTVQTFQGVARSAASLKGAGGASMQFFEEHQVHDEPIHPASNTTPPKRPRKRNTWSI